MNRQRPRLSEICEETFLFLTSFSRLSGRSRMALDDVRARLQDILRKQRKAAEQTPDVYELYTKAHYLLVVTADGVVRNSEWEHAGQWPLLEQAEFGTAVGGARFFALREDPVYKHEELQEIFFLCLAVGFKGQFLGRERDLAAIRNQVYLGLEHRIRDADEDLTPQAKGEIMGEKHVEVPVTKALRFVACLAGLTVMFIILAHYLYTYRVQDIDTVAGAIAAADSPGP